MSKLSSAILVLCILALSTQAAAQNQITISKDQFGDKWPLSLNSGVVRCLAIGNGSVVFEANGKTYAVNGTAKGYAKKYGFHSIEGIDLPLHPCAFVSVLSYQDNQTRGVLKLLGDLVSDRLRSGVGRRKLDGPPVSVANRFLQRMIVEVKRVIRVFPDRLESVDLSAIVMVEAYEYVCGHVNSPHR